MKLFLSISLFLFLLIIVTSCKGQKSNDVGNTYNDITKEELIALQKSGESFVLLDVRSPEEIAGGKINEDGLEINFYDNDFLEKLNKLAKDKNYIVYCRSGYRSGKASKMMMENGFTKVSNLVGGYSKWSK